MITCRTTSWIGSPEPASGTILAPPLAGSRQMKLGAFSISLVVKDIQASRQFYEALGFEAKGGDQAKGWLVMRNGSGTVIGLFKGMFDKNMLTFNPGWDQF